MPLRRCLPETRLPPVARALVLARSRPAAEHIIVIFRRRLPGLFRCLGGGTAGGRRPLFADGIPKIKSQTMAVSYGHNVGTEASEEYSASYKEQATVEEADLIPPPILSELPPLHFYARLSGGRTFKSRIPILLTDGPLPKPPQPRLISIFTSMFGAR